MTACNVTAGSPTTETCDGVDNDCDGMTDESNANCSGMTPLCDSSLPRCVQCRNAGDCSTSAPVCDPTTRLCRACNADNECSGATPACRTGVSCVQCTGTNRTACTGATSVCNTTTNRCVQCVSNTDCGGATPICTTTTNTCRACASDMDCGGSTPACATSGSSAGRCVQCSGTNSSACGVGMSVCNTATNLCVGCNSSSDCGGTTPFCENNRCRGCRANNECSGATPACKTSTGACVQCTAGSTMACSGATSQCNDTTNVCVQCLTNSQCPGERPVCDRNECRPCMNDMDCGGDTPACNTASGRCVQCTAMSAMACTGGTPLCNAMSNRCVQCNSDTECSGATPVCDGNVCRACRADMECAAREGTNACGASGACVQCTTASATACRSPTSVCNNTTNRCVQCNVNVECSGTTPVCDSNMCRGCRGDMDCAGREGTGSCAMTGACVECTAESRGACTGDRPVCDTMANRCVLCTPGQGGDVSACAMSTDGAACIVPEEGARFCGCTVDADCGGATSGRVCNTETRRCVAGCAAGEGRNGCPMGQSCTTTTPGERGQCTTTCNRDTDCTMAGRPVCFRPMGEGAMSVCVECGTDMHCAGRMDGRTRCIGDGNTCAQCSPTQTDACMGNMNGTACLNDGLCGCARDADCGGTGSGRVCDTMTRRCIAGCATGEGRNGCPDGLSCTSDSGMIGMCTASCNRDSDCRAPAPYCRVSGAASDAGMGAGSQCVECLMDTQCAGRSDGRTRCVNNSCAQCDPSMAMSCMGNAAGTLCTMAGACGCRADNDCGADQRCDTAANRCVMRPGMPDAGVADAGPMTMDGGTPRQGFEGGGCGCRVGGPASSSSPRSGGAAVLSLLAAVGLLARRRRRAA
jgi:MYXO-CTERM domain-containing protein